ncbi:WD40-repeat-containing domain protein [Hygrophoropsis aurantiaca]|uniref:WD40-repeat-containing domain protein n=1 Tax=Hygrophoropsis aurantiaca TaxID=72124 RepID=A0ACB7ZXP9_9AGAM|nr:WD40-repeat-containing domain protein [Hygrophoropsis aurantiaca]
MKPYAKAHILTDGHRDCINCLAFSPSGLYLASGGDDHTLIIWRVSDGSILYSLSFRCAVNTLLWHPTQEGVIFCGCQDGIVFRAKDFNLVTYSFNLPTLSLIHHPLKAQIFGSWLNLGFEGPVHCLDFNKSTNCLAVGIGHVVRALKEKPDGDYDGCIEFPNPRDPTPINSFTNERTICPRALHFYDHGRLLIVTYLNHGVVAWDVDKIVQVWCINPPFEAQQLGSSSLCTQTNVLVVHSLYAGIHMYCLDRQKAVRAFTCETESVRRHILSVSFIHNGNAIVSGAEAGNVCIWQTQHGNLLQVLEHGDDLIQAVAAFQNSIRYIATGSALKGQRNYIKIWRAPTGAYRFSQTTTHLD